MINNAYKTCFLFACIISKCCCTVFEDKSFAFKASVESEWKLENIDSVRQCIYNANSSVKTRIYIERIEVDTISVISNDECAQMYFLANYAVAKQNGIIQYFDSVPTLRQGALRAYEMFAYYKDNNNTRWWAEFSRWCAKEKYVFQITVLGDTGDVNHNFDKFKKVVDSIEVWLPDVMTMVDKSFITEVPLKPAVKYDGYFDLFGRKIKNGSGIIVNSASGLRVAPSGLILKIK